MTASVDYIREAGVRRRWHPRDVSIFNNNPASEIVHRISAPNIRNSLAIRKKHVASMYKAWNSLSSLAHGPLDTDLYARHIPVGRVCAERTCQASRTEADLGNFYAGSFNFAPGPGAYGGIWRNPWSMKHGPRMGQAPRKCMAPGPDHPQLAHAKRGDGGGPGPGAYATTGDSAVMGQRGSTFAAASERRGAASALELAVTKLRNLEWRMEAVKEGLKEPQKLRLGQALVVKIQSGRELERMEANASRLRKHVKRLAEIASKVASKCDPLPGVVLGASSDSGKGTKADRRPLTTTGVVASERIRGQGGKGTDRFYDPVLSTATFRDTPGPGTYSLARDDDALARGSVRRSPSFELFERRVVGEDATASRSLASLKLHSMRGDGSGLDRTDALFPYHSYISKAGPEKYTPNWFAPPLPSQVRRQDRFHDRQ